MQEICQIQPVLQEASAGEPGDSSIAHLAQIWPGN